MDRYLHHLVEDLREATKKAPASSDIWDNVDMSNPGELEDIAYVEQYLHGTPQKLSEIVGIEKIAFPPTDRLTEEQATTLCHEMIVLLEAFHFVPDFPEGLPYPIQYKLLKETWDDEQIQVTGGAVHIEFCTYEPSFCPFPEGFCGCRNFETDGPEESFLDDLDEDALPF